MRPNVPSPQMCLARAVLGIALSLFVCSGFFGLLYEPSLIVDESALRIGLAVLCLSCWRTHSQASTSLRVSIRILAVETILIWTIICVHKTGIGYYRLCGSLLVIFGSALVGYALGRILLALKIPAYHFFVSVASSVTWTIYAAPDWYWDNDPANTVAYWTGLSVICVSLMIRSAFAAYSSNALRRENSLRFYLAEGFVVGTTAVLLAIYSGPKLALTVRGANTETAPLLLSAAVVPLLAAVVGNVLGTYAFSEDSKAAIRLIPVLAFSLSVWATGATLLSYLYPQSVYGKFSFPMIPVLFAVTCGLLLICLTLVRVRLPRYSEAPLGLYFYIAVGVATSLDLESFRSFRLVVAGIVAGLSINYLSAVLLAPTTGWKRVFQGAVLGAFVGLGAVALSNAVRFLSSGHQLVREFQLYPNHVLIGAVSGIVLLVLQDGLREGFNSQNL